MRRPFVIAEAGVNHDGSLAKALRLVDIAADAGADAVKFQTFRADDIVAPGTPKVAYQERQSGGGSQHEMIRALELDEEAHRAIAGRCAARGIEFMSTPFDADALDLLAGLGMKRIKLASGEVTNKPLIEAAAARGPADHPFDRNGQPRRGRSAPWAGSARPGKRAN